MADVGARIYDFFRTHGYSPAAAAGIIGNTTQESGNRPDAPGGGLVQGQGGRTSSGTLQQQLHGILGELRGSERHTAEALAHVKGPREAARIFSEKFERPGIPMLANRERYAEEALRRYGGREVAHTTRAGQLAAEIAPHLSEPAAGPSAAQTADVVQMLQASLAPQQGSSVAGTALPRPQTSGGSYQSPTTPRVPAALTPQPQPSSTQDTVLGLLSKLGQDAAAEPEQQAQGEAPATLGTRAPDVGSRAQALVSRKGIVDFNGHKVAAWIAPILQYVQSKGVKPEITSGYRSKAEQARIYNSGVRPAAVPGTSNHEGDAFPRGAVDIANAQAVAKVLANSPYRKLLVYAGSKDPVHFSHPHGGSY